MPPAARGLGLAGLAPFLALAAVLGLVALLASSALAHGIVVVDGDGRTVSDLGIDEFQVDEEPPGFRLLALMPDGTIQSEVVRIAEMPHGVELASAGY